jgi:hypothetical protein
LKTGLFYAGDGRWSAKREDACAFVSTFKALTFAGDKDLHGVEVVLTSDKRESEVRINLEREGPSLKFYGVRHG